MTFPPRPASAVLDAGFLDARARLLDLAATLDRVGRAADAGEVVEGDPRYERLMLALAILADGEEGRAERVQALFSLPYDPDWPRPSPRD